MSSLECNSLSSRVTKSSVGKINAFNGRKIELFPTSDNITNRIKGESKLIAKIYKESTSPIGPRTSSDLFGTNQTVEDSINVPIEDFEVTFFNYKRLIELATTIDTDTGDVALDSGKYYKLLVFLVLNFGTELAYSLFTPPDRPNSGSSYADCECGSNLRNLSVPQQVRKSYNTKDLQTQINTLLGGSDVAAQKIKQSGILALDSIQASLYSVLTPLNSKRIYTESPRIEFCSNPDSDDTAEDRYQLKTINSNSSVYASLAFIGLAMRERIHGNSSLTSKYVDKISGHYNDWDVNTDFQAKQRLYPIKDVITKKNDVSFVNEKIEASGLFKSIDNTIVFGNYARDRERIAGLNADDNETYITPSSIYTAGSFQYQCEVTPPLLTPKDNYLFIRAAAPTSTNETDIAPDYKAYNIKLLDPSGNIITKYKDFIIRGDCDYRKDPKRNFTTYIVEPEKNYAALPSYYATFPLLGKPSGYKLNIEFDAICKAKPFTTEFTKGYENTCTLEERFVDTDEDDYLAIDGAPFSTINQDFHFQPNNSIRISEIEILADGSQEGFLSEGILNLTLQPEPTGTLFEREIYVGRVLNGTEFVNNIYPEDSSSIWKTSPDYDGNVYYSSDTDNRSRSELLDRLTNLNIAGNLKLDQTSPTGSGRLEVIFEHKKPYIVKRPTGGGIGFGSKYQGTFQKAELQFVETDDSFFTIDEISLHVKAKKADASVPDIFFDVVGYSDDCLLNVSSSPNGFLQNAGSGIGISPVSSGYTVLNELAIAGEGLSEKENYFVTRSPSRGDHYVLTQTPKITSTEFQTINVPLKIHQEQIDIFNRTPNYTMSSFFEKLYVDIYPLPSGTIISELILKVKHKPSAGMMMYTLGHELDTILRHTEVRLTPAAEKDYVNHVNQTISDSTKLSLIENIPHGYGNPDTLKTNYSRRWRGCEGSFYAGPFNPNSFAFDYYNPQIDSAFTYFYSDFSDVNKQVNHHWINSQVTDRHVVYDGDLENNIITNRGLRFNSNKLFQDQTVDYTTLDWTQDGDVLSGNILDAFNNGVKVLESSGCMNFGNAVATSGGFSSFVRFSPDISVSGVNRNLFNSGVLISKWDVDKDLEFLLGYQDGRLIAKASDIDGNQISIEDTSHFSEYQYPLSVLLTYNDNQSKKLKLYTQNEIYDGPFDIKRSESEEFELLSGNSDLVYGYSYGSGVGFNAYFTEIGISDYNELGGNIVEGTADPSVRQGNVQSFFDSHSVKFFRRLENLENSHNNLWKFVDEDTRKWHIGAFKYCEFSGDFDILTNRQGKDYIYHTYRGFDSTYDEIVDIPLPSNIKLDGVAYHTQVENDMLRFNLGDVEDRFYAVAPRISKKIPRGYNILDNAISVNTVIQHFCDADIVWPDGKIGAKLIISLYTKGRENPFRESINWGLVNRRVHYITPEDCWKKLNSNLTYGEICSNDEPWSNFVNEKITEETKETYFLNDINQMFIQYDLVYPSGEFNSTLRLSSIDVVIGDMLVKKDDVEDDLPLYSSGSLEYRDRVDFSIECSAPVSAQLPLYSSGADPIEINTLMPLFMGTGTFKDNTSLSLYTIKAQSIFDSFTQSAPTLFADSDFDEFRDDVKILLPFDNTLDDLSLNNYEASLPSDPSQILAESVSFPSYSSTNSKFGSSAIFNYDPAPANISRGVEFKDVIFNPEDFDGDWLIDFWFNLLFTNDAPVNSRGIGISTAFLTSDPTRINAVDILRSNAVDILSMFSTIPMGFGFENNKRIGFKVCFLSGGRLGFIFTAMDNLSQQEKNNGRFSENSTATVGNILIQPYNDYNFIVYLTTTANYEDLKNSWNKISIRKHNNNIEVYVGSTIVGQYELDEKVQFDTLDTTAHSYPHLRMFGTSIMSFALDDFRMTIGSSRGTENPGLILTPAPNPLVEPPPPPPPPDPEDPCNCQSYAFCCVDDPRIGNYIFPFYIEGAYEKNRDVVPFTIIADGPQDNKSLLLFAGGDNIQVDINSIMPIVVGDVEIDFDQIILDRTVTTSTLLFVKTIEEDQISKTQIPIYIGGTIGTFELNSSFQLYLLHDSPVAQNPDDIRLESFSWDGENFGQDIEVRDNPLSSIPANDEIRGVNTVCFGTCGFNSYYPCVEPEIVTHDTVWFSTECFNGGIFRSFTHYTNLNVGAFGGESPYIRNFYGMRKLGGLLPFNPYEITIYVMTGTDKIFSVPREITEWEYGTNEDVDYKPEKIVAETEDRIENINFGKSVAVNDDLMVVGVPNKTLQDSAGHVMPKCGELHVYRRLPAPSGYDWSDQDDKSDWKLEAKLSIPEEYRRDKFTSNVKQFFDEERKPLPFEGSTRDWMNQQNGRELGYSVDCTKTEDGREIIVAGGPGSIFDREFNPVSANPVEIALFIITNEFNPFLDSQEILDELRDRDILYRYFSDPPVKFSVKVIICEAILDTDTPSGGEIPDPKPSFVSQHQIHKHTSFNISTQEYKDKEALILNDLKEIFHEEFPLKENVLNSGIPALLSIYLDTSASLGSRSMGQDKIVGKGVLDQFIDYYKEYSYNNGLQNVQTPPAPASGFAFITLDNTEGWIRESSKALNDVTDTGRMIENDTFKLFANNLGSFNAEADEFNFPPPSGGCVYVFEKPKDQNYWHIIQQIDSPSVYTDDVPDRFGHAVSISDDGRVIAIGSPYCKQNVSIYQFNDSDFNLDFIILFNLQDWLDQNYRSTLAIQLRNALAIGVEQSIIVARRFYDNVLSDSQKYDFFMNYIQMNTDNVNDGVKPYRLIHHINSMNASDPWDSMFNNLIPTQRLGYSIDVNEDGTAVAIGSPTDSLGARDSLLTAFRYYSGKGISGLGDLSHHWQNYSYAGAVRLLQARNYYPHNKVVEYGRFGNLHETLNRTENNGYLFTQFRESVFNNGGAQYIKTNFIEADIPQDAGTLFIITPEVDAASEETIQKIKNWLSLGDRNLVLVGDDPFYEANGAYRSSNDIVNYILDRLDINLRIFTARNEYEARVNPEKFDNLKLNALPVPAWSSRKTSASVTTTTSDIYAGILSASGVGDIRLYDPDIDTRYECEYKAPSSDPFALINCETKPYRDINDRCNMPITHLGDLRASWTAQCIKITPGGCSVISYPVNTAFVYGSTNLDYFDCGPHDAPKILPKHVNLREKSEPMPLIAAAEKVSKTVTVDPIEPQEIEVPIKVGESTRYIKRRDISTTPNSGIKFSWSAENEGYSSLILNLNNITSNSLFFDPPEYNEHDAVLAATSEVREQIVSSKTPYGKAVYAAEEKYGVGEKESIVTLIAGTYTEDRTQINKTFADQGYNFYGNILRYVDKVSPKLAQIGGFTNRSSFTDGYSNSNMPEVLQAFGITYDKNVSLTDLINPSNSYDIAWIANSLDYASDADIDILKQFLSLGNKKLIITYGHNGSRTTFNSTALIEEYDQSSILSAKVAEDLCEKIGVSIKPLFLPNSNNYAAKADTSKRFAVSNLGLSSIVANKNSRIYRFNNQTEYTFDQYSFNTLSRGKVIPQDYPQDLIFIDSGSRGNILAFFGSIESESDGFVSYMLDVYDLLLLTEGSPIFRTGITKVTFDLPELNPENNEDEFNAYQIIYDIVSETQYESEPIHVYADANLILDFDGVDIPTEYPITLPFQELPIPEVPIRNINDLDGLDNKISTPIRGRQLILKTNSSSIKHQSAIYQVPSEQKQLNIYFHYNHNDEFSENPDPLRTIRLVAVSGVRVPSLESTTIIKSPIMGVTTELTDGSPGYSYDIDIVRRITTESDKYCPDQDSDNNCSMPEPTGYNTPGPEIEDGPVLVAQAVYHQGGYFNGYNKSTVTVISDASLIQGPNILVEGQSTSQDLPDFLFSLYPQTYLFSEDLDGEELFTGLRYESDYKIISPERGSPSRFINSYPHLSGLNNRFGGYQVINPISHDKFSDLEGSFDLTPKGRENLVDNPNRAMIDLVKAGDAGKFFELPVPPRKSPEESFREPPYTYNGYTKEEYEKLWYVDNLQLVEDAYYANSKIIDSVDEILYEDAGIFENIPPILRDTGFDHLDIEHYGSGYPGDLFGFSVKFHKGDLYVSAPFSAYSGPSITTWENVVLENPGTGIISGVEISDRGGAGVVYRLEDTLGAKKGSGSTFGQLTPVNDIPWAVKEKIIPEQIHLGHDGYTPETASGIIGIHSYDQEFLDKYFGMPDLFGYHIDAAGDILAISAPGHDFDIIYEDTEAQFIRKEFNEQFNIQKRIIHDIGIDSVRQNMPNSGINIINRGSIFTYENRITDWGSKTQSWQLIHKLNEVGHNSNIQNSGENSFFGQSFAIDRSYRSDSDYILAIGNKNHQFDNSSNTPVSGAGAVFSYDGMLRRLRPAYSHPDTFIAGSVFGDKEQDIVDFKVSNDNKFNNMKEITGIISSNKYGEIYIEASGHDKLERSYSENRPYVHSITGKLKRGTPIVQYGRLFVEGSPFIDEASIDMFVGVENQLEVYNTVDLFTQSAYMSSGILPLYASGSPPESGFFPLMTSGSFPPENTFLNTFIRGF